nr:uncharacterized protein LOC129271051 [Lytechinus pictus]
MDVYWTLSDCGIDRRNVYGFIFSYENPSTGQIKNITLTSPDNRPSPQVLGSMASNTKYCIRMVAFVKRYGKPRNLGDWSDKVCNRTLPTAPDVILNIAKKYTSVQNEERPDERDVTFTWSVNQNKNSEQPFQGITSFKIEVSLDDETQNGTNASVFTYNLDDRYLYLLPEDNFNYTIKGLSKHENYTISVTAVNSKGYSNPQELKVSALQEKSVKISGGLVAGLCILVTFLIMALLAFGFQRLKNNSKPMPTPVYHGNLGNIQPTTIENEVFDELPSVLKESQRQLLMSMSIESEDSQLEDKGYRTSSTGSSSSRGGSNPSCTHGGKGERVPLLEMPSSSRNTDKSPPYSVLSQLMPSPPPIQMAPDALETDLDSLSPVGGHYSFSEEGLSLGGSSDYNQLENTRDTSYPNPYYAMVGLVPVRIADSPRDSGYASVGIRKCSSGGCDDCTDDEICQPPTPALPNCSYFYSLSDRSKSAGQQPSLAHCDPCTGLPMSENLTTIVEGPEQYVLLSGSESTSPQACNSGYVAHDDVFLGKPAVTQHESSNNYDPSSSSQSSPEHAVIIHPKPLENIKSPHECIDGKFVSDLTNAPLNIGSGPSSAAIHPVSSVARSNSRTPSDNGFVDCPPSSASSRIRPNGNTGYVTAEEQTPLRMSSAVEDTHQSQQPMQNPTAETVRSVPSLNGNIGHVQAEQLLPLKLSSTAEDTHRSNQPLQNPVVRTVLPTPFQNASGYVGLPITRTNPSGYISVDDLPSTNLRL